jgi:hypothetical protein
MDELEAIRAAIMDILRDLSALREQGFEPDLEQYRAAFFEIGDIAFGRTADARP